MRGIRFSKNRAGYLTPTDYGGSVALREVATWLGFTWIQEYTTALSKERERIFDRAQD